MFEFYIYETVTLPIHVSDPAVLKDYDKIVVSLKQGRTQLDFFDGYGIDAEEGYINLYLDQEQTSRFKPGKVALQVNFYYTDKERDTSSETIIRALDNLYKEVIE